MGDFYAWLALWATESLQIYFYCITGLLLWFLEVWLGLLDLTGSGGVLKFTLVRVTWPLCFILILFWDGCNKLWFEILVIQAINHPGHLKVGGKGTVTLCLLLCNVYVEFVILVRLAIMAINFSGF